MCLKLWNAEKYIHFTDEKLENNVFGVNQGQTNTAGSAVVFAEVAC